MVTVQKSVLRKEAQRTRDRLTPAPDCIERASALFFQHINPTPDQIVSAYWPRNSEFDTTFVLKQLLKQGITCALPVTEKGQRIIKFAQWDESTKLISTAFDIMEPVTDASTQWVDPDIVIAPLLSFDHHGFRLGYGGGSYDMTLEQLRKRKSALVVGWAYAEQACPFNLPHEAHDIPCDWVITPQEAHHYPQKKGL